MNPVSWTSGDQAWDGLANAVMYLGQVTSTPTIRAQAGALGPTSADLTVGAWHVANVLYNGASSKMTIDANATSTGNVGASNAGGFTLCKNGAGLINYGNFSFAEIVIFDGEITGTDLASVYAYLAAIRDAL